MGIWVNTELGIHTWSQHIKIDDPNPTATHTHPPSTMADAATEAPLAPDATDLASFLKISLRISKKLTNEDDYPA